MRLFVFGAAVFGNLNPVTLPADENCKYPCHFRMEYESMINLETNLSIHITLVEEANGVALRKKDSETTAKDAIACDANGHCKVRCSL
jgi:hypothetical protein